MTTYDYDFFVIGGGSGGVRSARVAAGHGARVAIAEEYRYGGTCVIRGCVPKKLFVYASHFRGDFDDAAGFGWRVDGARFDWTALRDNKDVEIDRLNAVYERLLDQSGVTALKSRAQVADPHSVEIDGKTITAGTILIATGGRPFVPDTPGADLAITSNEAFHLETLGDKIVVVGGGFIAVEFAGIFAGFGIDVTQLYRRQQILRGFDRDVRAAVSAGLEHHGVDLRVETDVVSLARRDGRIAVQLTDGSTLFADHVMYATGRVPNTRAMGLAEAGVTLGPKGQVVVDEYSRSSVDSIYAVGDCTGRISLTPVAIREGTAVADTVFGGRPTPIDHACVPSAVFAQPPAGVVGLTEAEARAAHAEIDIYKSRFRPLKHTLTGRDEQTMMKLIVDRTTQRVLGVHMVGDDAPEIIQCMAIALKMGATKADLDATTALHPSAAEEFVTMRTPVDAGAASGT